MMLVNSVVLMICATMGATSYQLSRTVAMRSSSSLKMSDSYTVVQAGADPKASLLADVCSYSRTQMNEYVLALEKINPTAEPASAALLNGVWEIVATGFGSPGIIGFQAIKAIPGSIVDVNGNSVLLGSRIVIIKFLQFQFQFIKITILPRVSSIIADITLTISSVQPRITASTTLKVLSAKIDVEVKLDLEVNQLSSQRTHDKSDSMFFISMLHIPITPNLQSPRILPHFY